MKKLLIILLILLNSIACASNIYFGSYWQTYEIDGKKAPIEWIILDETEDAYLLISKYSLDASIFNNNKDYTTWENSYMREFLNSYFYKNAFSAKEKKRLILTTAQPHINPEYPYINQGQTTQDYIFLLSIEEVLNYFPINNDRIAFATSFAKIGHARIIGNKWAGVYTSPLTGATCWRLRTMGIDNYHACAVRENGSISMGGDILFAPHYAVRPCIWIRKEQDD